MNRFDRSESTTYCLVSFHYWNMTLLNSLEMCTSLTIPFYTTYYHDSIDIALSKTKIKENGNNVLYFKYFQH